MVEYLVRARSTWGTRLYVDGRTEEWQDPAGWRPLVKVAPSEVAAFVELARGRGFLDLPEVLAGGESVDDGSAVSWSITVGGRRHRVTARATGSSLDPVLRALNDALQLMIGRALAVAADEAGHGPGT